MESEAEFHIRLGNCYPYDASDEWWGSGGKPPEAIDWAHAAARGIIHELQDRRGIKQGFEGVDEDTRREIVGSLATIVRQALMPSIIG